MAEDGIQSPQAVAVKFADIDDNNLPSSSFKRDTIVRVKSKLGYEEELFPGLGLFGSFAVGFTQIGMVMSISGLYSYALTTGGPAVLIWSYIVVFIFTTIVSFSMAELCSAYPCAGSVYYWAAQVVPKKYAPIASYTCGWSNFLANTAAICFFAYNFAAFLSASVSWNDGSQFTNGQQVGLSIAVLFVWTILNTFRIDQVGWINSAGAAFQIGTVIVIVCVILVLTPSYSTATFVFTTYINETGFNSVSYVVAIGSVTSLFVFNGYDGTAHLAEETHESSSIPSLAVLYTVFMTGILGILYILSLLFVTPDVDTVLAGNSVEPIINTFAIAAGDYYAGMFAWFLTINFFFGGMGSTTVTARILYAMSRDKALPYSEKLATINPHTKSPIYIIIVIFIINSCLLLIPLNADGLTAFLAIVGLSASCFQISYAIPIALKTYFFLDDFPKTSYSLGKLSRPIGLISSLWLFGSAILFYFPSLSPVTPENMNWLIVVMGFFFTVFVLIWIFHSQYTFKGPPISHEVSQQL